MQNAFKLLCHCPQFPVAGHVDSARRGIGLRAQQGSSHFGSDIPHVFLCSTVPLYCETSSAGVASCSFVYMVLCSQGAHVNSCISWGLECMGFVSRTVFGCGLTQAAMAFSSANVGCVSRASLRTIQLCAFAACCASVLMWLQHLGCGQDNIVGFGN